MNIKRSLIILAVGLSLAASGALSWAVEEGVQIPLMATKHHIGASGKVFISDQMIDIKARGLKPNSVYTVWFVNMKPKKHETGAGKPPYMFKTDLYGSGVYSYPLYESPFGKWQMVMVVLHPNGDPGDMKNMVGALSAKIMKK
jgi:hypothetical protein